MVSEPLAIIEAKSVNFNYTGEQPGSIPALSGINFNVRQGEHVALIGPNGSGKTTLLKLFNALLIPQNGEVLVEGISTSFESEHSRIRQACGMIFQNPDNQLVATTVEEDIAFGLENLTLPSSEIRRRVDDVAHLLGLTPLMRQPPHLLSGGEKQRVAIAGILAMEPKCILMDEPTSMLDPAGRHDVISTVHNLNQNRGLALVHVTHFPEEAANADRVVVLDQGRIVEEGPPEQVLTNIKMLHSHGLQGTAASELVAMLREDGYPLSPQVLYSRELVDSICSLEQTS
ncbi:MAG: energy-coupling factor transporter ATPase [Bacillota bacterium]